MNDSEWRKSLTDEELKFVDKLSEDIKPLVEENIKNNIKNNIEK